MDWHIALGIYVLVGGALLAGGVWIGVVMGVTGALGLALVGGFSLWQEIGDILWFTSESFTMVAIPLFVLMGEIILRSGVSSRLYAGLSEILAPVPGALFHANIAGCAIFSALSGSSTATAMTVGTVAIPEMKSRGYDNRLTFGSLAGGGCLGILIPPSIPMIIYGTIAQESVVALFFAGIVPGLIVSAMFMIYVAACVAFRPSLAPRRGSTSLRIAAIWRGLGLIWPVVLLLGSVIGGMYFGVVTPTEAAAFGCTGALVLAWIFGRLTWADFVTALNNTVVTTAVVIFIVINAQILTYAISNAGIAQGLAKAIVDIGLAKWQFFFFLYLMYFVLGMFIDGISMMLLTLPVFYGTVKLLGFDGVWFGVALIVMIEIGQITPPMGLNLFAIHSISGSRSFGEVAWGAQPFVVLLTVAIAVIYVFPELVLFVPEHMMARH